MSSVDVDFAKEMFNRVLADVQSHRPELTKSSAGFYAATSRDAKGKRWMTWEFEGVKVQDYFSTIWECHARGWTLWLEANGYDDV